MSEMIERVAKAIWALNEDTDCHDYDQLSSHAKERADEWARAAIAAMREPTDAMVSTADDTVHTIEATTEYPAALDQIRTFYRTMIDAALK